MKLSMRTRYGLRAVLDLATTQEGPVSIREIASRQHISSRYLENIFNDLVREGILSSTRGKGGGFALAVPLESVTLLRLVEILEGPVMIVDCVGTGAVCPVKGCMARDVWASLNGKITAALSDVTLAQILEEERAKTHGNAKQGKRGE